MFAGKVFIAWYMVMIFQRQFGQKLRLFVFLGIKFGWAAEHRILEIEILERRSILIIQKIAKSYVKGI